MTKTGAAFLGDAVVGSLIHFTLPAMVNGRDEEFAGMVSKFERQNNGNGPVIAFRLAGTDRTFRCRPDLHITILDD